MVYGTFIIKQMVPLQMGYDLPTVEVDMAKFKGAKTQTDDILRV